MAQETYASVQSSLADDGMTPWLSKTELFHNILIFWDTDLWVFTIYKP